MEGGAEHFENIWVHLFGRILAKKSGRFKESDNPAPTDGLINAGNQPIIIKFLDIKYAIGMICSNCGMFNVFDIHDLFQS